MAKKIITFISVLNPRGDTLPEEKNYYYPKGEEGTPLKGRQTNEAPLKYLLREYGPIEQILCLCTDEVLQPVRGRDGTELAPSTAVGFLRGRGPASSAAHADSHHDQGAGG